ncbi:MULTISPECIES: hypothetical protein [unclassified Lentimonas]
MTLQHRLRPHQNPAATPPPPSQSMHAPNKQLTNREA